MKPMNQPIVVLAGATGHLGSLIAQELRKRQVEVRAIVRPGTSAARSRALRDAGVAIHEQQLSHVAALTQTLRGATAVVSTLQGLRDVVMVAQGHLLEAAVAAKVPRFIPSDFALDFTQTVPGSNRNLDLRREFHETLEASGIQYTSILNGAFMEMMAAADSPMISKYWRRVLYFGSKTQKLDLTSVPDVAAFTAAAAIDPRPLPKVLRIAGSSVSPAELADSLCKVSGEHYTTFCMGSLGFLQTVIRVLKYVVGGTDKLFPIWQGMQYLENMVSGKGKLESLDNGRYSELNWLSIDDALAKNYSPIDKAKKTL